MGIPDPWPFDQPRNASSLSLERIFRGGCPILMVSHDEDDHGWQFLDGEAASVRDAWVVLMEEVVRHDPTVVEVADLLPGWIATRERVGGPWMRKPHAVEE